MNYSEQKIPSHFGSTNTNQHKVLEKFKEMQVSAKEAGHARPLEKENRRAFGELSNALLDGRKETATGKTDNAHTKINLKIATGDDQKLSLNKNGIAEKPGSAPKSFTPAMEDQIIEAETDYPEPEMMYQMLPDYFLDSSFGSHKKFQPDPLEYLDFVDDFDAKYFPLPVGMMHPNIINEYNFSNSESVDEAVASDDEADAGEEDPEIDLSYNFDHAEEY